MASTFPPGHDPLSNNHPSIANMAYPMVRRASRSSGSQSGSRPTRVEKPKSTHNSPRTMERRKTTTGPVKRYATLDDHYNFMFGGSREEEEQVQTQTSRPMSWHPSSSQFQVPPRSSGPMEHAQAQDFGPRYNPSSRNSAHGSDFYSLSARNSMFQDQMQTSQAATYPHNHHRGSHDSDSSWQASSTSTPATEPMPWYLQEWARKNEEHAAISRNGSSDFLPIQHPSEEEEAMDEDMEDSGKELIGMGLYDLPDPALSWSSGLVESTGKGLKLEETWQPPEEDVEDEDADAEGDADDASSDDASVEDLPAPPPAAPQPAQTIDTLGKPQVSSNMDGQSFFFDDDENYTKEWYFQQLKQSTMPVRDAGLGYGWL
ncbi:hypothetical protein BU24DRAFT_426378 [Aaosphaeria arxii CBS 175.79]|uniref:Uncharacterized protein n=1 Tax=Aaosphaeria arxii CBS 175.79 TaxID=1450172 RepID=A0A6A5XEN0_9PLEO|nr:uncharacterized protein BU24DRAFT_426378 [Aaosphaeria arxii CBS 175.79]KAF2011296.1 hypothetical protein BU24DRAFT_426378 [Aaosphaeria arxii CBS 175.79]